MHLDACQPSARVGPPAPPHQFANPPLDTHAPTPLQVVNHGPFRLCGLPLGVKLAPYFDVPHYDQACALINAHKDRIKVRGVGPAVLTANRHPPQATKPNRPLCPAAHAFPGNTLAPSRGSLDSGGPIGVLGPVL